MTRAASGIMPPQAEANWRMTVGREVRVLAGAAELAAAAAEAFTGAARAAIAARGTFRVALAGGSTPRAVHAQLVARTAAGESVDWARVEIFWGDERHVPPDHPDSNYRMARETLLQLVPIPEANVHRVRAELPDAAEAAADYAATLRRVFGLGAGAWPAFDLVLLGIGPDGHTASLFPGSTAVAERERLCVATWVEKLQASRITLTVPVFNAARAVVFVAAGTDKAPAVAGILTAAEPPRTLPARLVAPHAGALTFLLDRAAAGDVPAAELTR